jgi:thioredoxin reductase (NADPH)
MTQTTYDAIVIGEGICGLTAANALARAGCRTATLEARLFGGLVLNVNELDPAPDERAVSGAEFATELMQANAELGVASIQQAAGAVHDREGLRVVATASGRYPARHVVVASGARLRKLNVPGENEFEGRGVSSCADCDGPLYQEEEVAVVGGGDSALQEALVLAKFCRKVHIVHRGDSFRAQKHFAEQVRANPRISILWKSSVEAIGGDKTVERVRIRRADAGAEELACAGVFAYVGLAPNAEFLPPALARDAGGFVITDTSLETGMRGVWAAGAVRSGYGGLLSDAADEGRRVAQAIAARLGKTRVAGVPR